MANTLEKPKLKRPPRSWGDGVPRTISFIITENCQLRCKYCYLPGKNKDTVMSFDIAKKSIDYFLKERSMFNDDSVIIEFMGGEAFLEIELIDKISDYFKKTAYELDHPWFNNYRFSFSTNGILYGNDKIQDYIEKNRAHISVGITIDGTKAKHDLQRVYPDGSGSYDDIVKNIPLWLKQFPEAATKVTVASDDLPYIKESVLHLWSIGITNIHINCVYEDVWKEGDDKILEDQLKSLADHIVDNEMYTDYYCSFFGDFIGKPMKREDNKNWCGCGKHMIAVDHKGDFFPCNRFTAFSLADKEERPIGNCFDGIDLNKLRPYQALDRITQSTPECIDCEVASGCSLCVGYNYDSADTDTVYQRAVYICNMHKARVRASKYYYERLEKEKGIKV